MRLTKLFGIPVESAEFLMTDNIGLSVVFKNRTTIDAIDIIQIVELTNRYEILRLRNVFGSVTFGETNISACTRNGILMHDPFHRDIFKEKKVGVTELLNSGHGRDAPTVYAYEDDVRRVVTLMAQSGDYSGAIVDTLNEMSRVDYFFAPSGTARKILLEAIPDFTDQVFARIAEGRKFKQNWRAGEFDAVFHSNSGKILHGRLCGIDGLNVLSANYH